MDLFRSMHAFVAAVQAGSMSAAAGQLGMSAAMVGQHVAALEAQLGTRLLNRTTRRQSLTDFGSSYFEQCRDILERVTASQKEAEIQQSVPRGLLRITAPVSFGTESLIPVVGRYSDTAPNVTLDLVLTDRTVDLVEEGFDLAFRIGVLPDNRLIARRLMPYRMMICASPEYLARAAVPAHPADLAKLDMVGFTASKLSPWRLSKGGETVTVRPRYKISVNSGPALRNAACAGLGVVMQPESLLARDVNAGRLIQLFPDWKLRERPMSLLYYRDQRMTPRLRSFITFAVKEFGATSDQDAIQPPLKALPPCQD
ncbi:LysR family transcriptional regulator [Radicibacter daui]|uniref:LysR family transcriptional regulator n=1 Tax=Radicibacter daui TaxID=3064829 RepID=UPI004046D2A9